MAVQWNDAMLPTIRAAAMRGVMRWIGDVEDRSVKLIMNPPKSGRTYRRRGVTHQASAPGEAPANDTSRLVNSRRVDLFEERLRARLLYSTAYAAFLELGTSRMEPRPFLRRALYESVDDGHQMVLAEIAAVLQ